MISRASPPAMAPATGPAPVVGPVSAWAAPTGALPLLGPDLPLARLLPAGSVERPDVSVVVLSYQVRDLLVACLRSLCASVGDLSYEVIVVDNRSTDGSAAAARAACPEATVIEAPRNGGYAWGNNLGLRRARGRYLLLLNPDTVVPPDALHGLVAYAEARPWVGVVGPKLVRPDGRLDLACRRGFPTPMVALYHTLRLARLFPASRRFGRYNLTYLDPDVEAEVDAVAGACMLVRAEAARQVGLLDERYFMYGEDIDWAYRIKAAGHAVCYYPRVVVLHHKGESSRRAFLKANAAFYRAMLTFHRTHLWRRTPLPVNLAVVAGVRLRWGLARLAAAVRRPGERRVGSS